MTLVKGGFKAATQDKKVLHGMVMKVVAARIAGLILVVIFAEIGKALGAWTLDTTGLGVIVIMLAAPGLSNRCLFNWLQKTTIINK